MNKVDYIVVGFGLAGMAFCDQLEINGKNFRVFDGGTPSASRVAAGLYNPVTLKRYTLPWKGEEQFDLAETYFERLSKRFATGLAYKLPVYKILSSAEDQNNWFEASDHPGLSRFLKPELIKESFPCIQAPFHYGEVKETGRVDIGRLLDVYKSQLLEKGHFFETGLDYDQLVVKEESVVYGDLEARCIIFAEGYGIKNNPFFKSLPLIGNKGEYISIKAPDLRVTAALKSSFFVIPLGDDLYKVGATFNWKDKDVLPSKEARQELTEKLENILKCDYEIVVQEAGIRPTTGDRRPLAGRHPKFRNVVLLNGLGTRGTMMAPFLAGMLFEHLELGKPLLTEADINRFSKKLS